VIETAALKIFTSENARPPKLACRANDFRERFLYNVPRPWRNLARPGFHAAMISYGHDIAALKS
jgi:hypothetical protein